MSPTPQAQRPIGRSARAAIAITSLVAGAFGIGAIGAGTAFAQTTHHAQAGARASSKTKASKHERRESATVRVSETVSTDPVSTDPHEPADPSSTDPSANDEGSGDTSVSDSNDTADQSSG
jgi:hypothetical protein